VGLGLAQGKSVEQIVAELGEVAEGVPTATALYGIAHRNNIYLPIAREVYAMLQEEKSPQESVRDLLK
jgi:glycerol-3-phosphate dehydrogenase (NAD(P)+)